MQEPEINIGVFVAHSPGADVAGLEAFTHRMVDDARPELESATGARWLFDVDDPTRLSSDDPRRPSDFLDEASLRMVEGPFDLVVVVTDTGLISRTRHVVAGLASEVGRVVVVSTRRLVITPRGRRARSLTDASVRWNAATLLLHLLGHTLGLEHTRDDSAAMAPFLFDEERRDTARFSRQHREWLARRRWGIPERELVGGGALPTFRFHITSAVRHAREVMAAVARSRAVLLPLSLPRLSTAAVAPTLILVFTAEIWDVGLSMGAATAAAFAIAVVLAAAAYLGGVQGLYFPRKEKHILTEHMAVVNSAVFLTLLLAMLGLFVMVGLFMLVIEVFIFPSGLMRTWPTLEVPAFGLSGRIRLAVFISTIGVATGALGGGLESRTVIRHLALFDDAP